MTTRAPDRQAIAGRAALALALAAGVCLPVVLALRAATANGFSSFPLDDAWIHLQFARNLAWHHTLAYWPGDAAVGGSTSPLYTLLLAAGFELTRDEKLLSVVLGAVCQAAFLVALAQLARRRLGDGLAAAALLIVGLDSDVAILAVSGMETPLFLALVVVAVDAHSRARARLAGAVAGLASWVRPEGLLLLAVLALDGLLPDAPRPRRRRLGALVGGAAAPLVAYGAFNLWVGGSLLPDTFAAKTAYYALNSRAGFLTGDVAGAFGHGGLVALLPLFAVVLASELGRLWRGRRGEWRPELGWSLALPLAYLAVLPFAHRFHRYLVPALPTLVLACLALVRGADPDRSARRWRWAGVVLVGLAVGLQAWSLPGTDRAYRGYCRVHHALHEATGRWLAAHTPADAVVAAHDVGAIAFYSERRVVDMVGVVLPEVVEHLHQPGYQDYLRGLFARRGVTHLAVLRSWFQLDNAAPLFVAAPGPEVMEVYRWDADSPHMVPPAAARLQGEAIDALRSGDAPAAVERLRESLAVDDGAAHTWLLYGVALERTGRTREAAGAYERSLKLFPGLDGARARLAALAAPAP